MEYFNLILEAFVLGVIGGSIPGPILTCAFAETIKSGIRNSLKIVLYAMIAEILIAVIILSALSAIPIADFVFKSISIIGSAVLFWMFLEVWKINQISNNQEKTLFTFKAIFFLTLFNGALWIFWITVCIPKAFMLSEIIFMGQFVFLASFEIGWIIATVFWVFLFSCFRPMILKSNFIPIIFKILALALLYFSIKTLFYGLSYFFSF